MSDDTPRDDPDLLLEASRAYNAAGKPYQRIAEVVSDLATRSIGARHGKVETAILCDAAALRLAGRLPGGYEKALELLAGLDAAQSEDNGGRVPLLRALARGQQYKSEVASDAIPADLATLADAIAADLRNAFRCCPDLFDRIKHHWLEGEEDDLRLAADQESVRAVINEQEATKKR